MKEHINLQIDFQDADRSSVSITTQLVGHRLREAHLVLFSSFTLRQLHNLGRIEPTNQLSRDLANVASRVDALSIGSSDYGVRLADYPAGSGEKQFVAELKYDAEVALLHLDTPGFGVMGQGVNYFAPKSVLVLAQHLAIAHAGDRDFLSALGEVARMCAVAYQLDKISTFNQPSLARIISNEAGLPKGSLSPSEPAISTSKAEVPAPTRISPQPIPSGHSYCQSCGLPAPTRDVHFYQNIGMFIMRRYSEVEGQMCKSCIDRHFWDMTGKTMLFGWWGLISFFLAPLMILNNAARWLATRGMPRPLIQTSRGPSPIWVFATIGGFLLIGYFVYSLLFAISSVQPSQPSSATSRQDSCAVEVIGFSTYLILDGINVQLLCSDLVAQDRSLYRITSRPPSSPIICREGLLDVTATVVDTSSSRTGGGIMCQSIYEFLSE